MADHHSFFTNNGGSLFGKRKQVPFYSHPMGQYLFANSALCNFAISGSGPVQAVTADVLRYAIGEIPVIVLHGNDAEIIGLCASIWQEKFGPNPKTQGGAFWLCENGSFEPFLGMDSMDVVDVLQQLARSAGYRCNPHFAQTILGHLHLLDLLGCNISLSGLYYLCSFHNMTEFEENINDLDCSEEEKQSLIWEIGFNDRENVKQLEIFRDLIMSLATEARNSGWSPDNDLGSMNITLALYERAVMLLPLDDRRSACLLRYLCQELQLHKQQPFLLLIDDVQLANSGICTLLQTSHVRFRFGLLSENLVGMLGEGKGTLESVAEKIHKILLFKHGMATTAQILSDLIGKENVQKTTVTQSTRRRWLSLFPDRTAKSVSTTQEKEQRVDAKEIMSLAPGQVILFDSLSNEIIRF